MTRLKLGLPRSSREAADGTGSMGGGMNGTGRDTSAAGEAGERRPRRRAGKGGRHAAGRPRERGGQTRAACRDRHGGQGRAWVLLGRATMTLTPLPGAPWVTAAAELRGAAQRCPVSAPWALPPHSVSCQRAASAD